MSDEQLNENVFRALAGLRTDIARDISKLLRSHATIDPIVRERLADAFEGQNISGIQLSLSGQGPLHKFIDGIKKRKKWTAIGRWCNQYKNESGNVSDAIKAEAGELFGVEPLTVRPALTYTNRLEEWLQQARACIDPESPLYDIELVYHTYYARKTKPKVEYFEFHGLPVPDTD